MLRTKPNISFKAGDCVENVRGFRRLVCRLDTSILKQLLEHSESNNGSVLCTIGHYGEIIAFGDSLSSNYRIKSRVTGFSTKNGS